MPGAVIPPVAPQSPVDGGASPHFSAKLGAWIRPIVSAKRARQGFVQPATKRRPGNVTLSDKAKWWLACLIWNTTMWGALIWVWVSFFHAGDRP